MKKSVIALVLCVALLFAQACPVAAVWSQPEIIAHAIEENADDTPAIRIDIGEVKGDNTGDVNGDGKVNLKDSIILARYVAKWTGYDETTVDLDAADVNGDGKVNLKDSIILARHVAKWTGYEELPYTD